MVQRETWATRIGFILAAVGSAVGLGNIWRFPYLTAENGGAAFLVVYLIAVLVIGFPAMLAEFVIGRNTKRNVVDAFGQLGHPVWRAAGALFLLTGFWILAYYSVVGGWVFRYIVGSATGAYLGGDPATYFGTISTGMDALLFHALFMGITIAIVAFGIQRGIELSTKVMVPSIIVLMVGLAIWAGGLTDAASGYSFFLNPDPGAITGNIVSVLPAAVGQALFTLSLGMGAMITYASYIGEDDNLVIDGFTIVVLNTAVGILAGLVVFPLLASGNIDYGEAGASAIFVTVASAFQQLPAGRLLGLVFFGVVAIAALSSAISLLEVVVAYFVDNFDVSRPILTGAIGGAMFVAGIPAAFDTGLLTLYDNIASQVLLPVGVLLVVAFVGWFYGRDAVDEISLGTDRLRSAAPLWLWHVRSVLLVAVVVTLAFSVAELAGMTPA